MHGPYRIPGADPLPPTPPIQWLIHEHCLGCPCLHAALPPSGHLPPTPSRASASRWALAGPAAWVFLMVTAGAAGALAGARVQAHAKRGPTPEVRQNIQATSPWSNPRAAGPGALALPAFPDPNARRPGGSMFPSSATSCFTRPQGGSPSPAPSGGPVRVLPLLSLTRVGSESHDPAELLRRAERLAAAGVDVTVARTRLSTEEVQRWNAGKLESPQIAVEVLGGVRGFRLSSVRAGSPLAAGGLQAGDFITAIDGYELTSPDRALVAYDAALHGNHTVVELSRAGRSMILSVTWPGAPR